MSAKHKRLRRAMAKFDAPALERLEPLFTVKALRRAARLVVAKYRRRTGMDAADLASVVANAAKAYGVPPAHAATKATEAPLL